MGRKLSEETLYAMELGIEESRKRKRLIRKLGGASRLRALSPEVRNLLTARIRRNNSGSQKVEES